MVKNVVFYEVYPQSFYDSKAMTLEMGTNEDLFRLFIEIHRRNMFVILDLILEATL